MNMIGIAAFMMYDDFISKKAIALIPFNWSKLAAEFLHFPNHILVVGTGKWLNRGAGFGLEMTYFGIFKLEFEKNYSPIWNQHSWICTKTKVLRKTKEIHIWNWKFLIWVFLDGNSKKLSSYSKSAPSSLSRQRVSCGNKKF